jgi:predicted nucleotidyltransferase component of viral defense system
MIPASDITKWGTTHLWPTREQIEQDLLLSQAICEVAQDELLGRELVLRGGTAFHKLFLPKPYRYSEDLDYVRTSKGAIGNIMKHLTAIGQELGYKVNTKMGMYPKVFWKSEAETGNVLKIKIEINTFERSPALPLITKPLEVDSEWYSSSANILTFRPEELVATKIRALYQRSKGRDLFDLWLALAILKLDSDDILAAFPPYRPEKTTGTQILANLEAKIQDRQFRDDVNGLIVTNDLRFDPQIAAQLIIDQLLSKL